MWKPIDSAPKDERIIGFIPNYGCYFMRWDTERWHRSPQPHFSAVGWCYGVRAMRESQPTHWMPVPDAPKDVSDSGLKLSVEIGQDLSDPPATT